MSEDIKEPQETPENDAHLQTEGSQEALAETQAPEESAPSEAPAEEEKIVFTKEEFDNHSAKLKAIAERRAKREADSRYQAELEKIQSQNVPQHQQPYQQNAQPSPDHVWDDLLGWVHGSVRNNPDNYAKAVTDAINSLTQQPAPQQATPQQQSSPPTQPAQQFGGLSKNALDQIDELIVDDKDFLAKAGQMITPSMANAAALHPKGLKMFSELYTKDPSKLFELSRMSADEQKFKVWDMQKESAVKQTKKVSTNATPQVAPLESNGVVNKDYSDMSFAERKKKSLASKWGD